VDFLALDQKSIDFPNLYYEYLYNEFFLLISVVVLFHSLVLIVARCISGDLNRQGQTGDDCNDNQLMLIKAKGFNIERVVMISCDDWHSLALIELNDLKI
jgi:hypothetical protein